MKGFMTASRNLMIAIGIVSILTYKMMKEAGIDAPDHISLYILRGWIIGAIGVVWLIIDLITSLFDWFTGNNSNKEKENK